VVSNDFLPFADRSFDLVTCIEAFQYVEEPGRGVEEIRRVLRPGGTVLISVPFVWEYDRSILERRYTGPELADLLRDWDAVKVVENGGRAVTWTTLTGTMLDRARRRLPRPIRTAFPALYVVLNALGALLDGLERRETAGSTTLPMNLLVTARRPQEA
jgi:SAM-dependent methyltransferase